MEVEPADARPASSASGPADTAPTDMSAQKRPRDPASDNMVSSSPMQYAPAMPASQFVTVTTVFLSTDTGRACQSLAHHTTLMGRCLKSADRWAPLCVGLQSRSTSTQIAERQRTASWRGKRYALAATLRYTTVHPVPKDPSALTPLPHYLPTPATPYPCSGHFLWGDGSKAACTTTA
eukprot:scaffold2058_cov115-Isochrysis_galbana.AAC.20